VVSLAHTGDSGAGVGECNHEYRIDNSGNKRQQLVPKKEGNELLAEMYQAGRQYWAATDPKMGIWDFSSVTEVALSTQFLRFEDNEE
jgi:hypothetical protein